MTIAKLQNVLWFEAGDREIAPSSADTDEIP